ncbi:MAG: hypothetical protein ACREMY_14760 [bacterium]
MNESELFQCHEAICKGGPCSACRQEWVLTDEGRYLTHLSDCEYEYLLALNIEAERQAAWLKESSHQEAAKPFLVQYLQGRLTVAELAGQLATIVNTDKDGGE